MHVVLLERVEKLGQMGDVVKVRNGFARNFLLPRGKALRATQGNMDQFERSRAQLEAQNLERRSEAEQVGEKLDGKTFIAIRQSSESGQLYGSVSPRDIATLVTEGGFTLTRTQVMLDKPIKELGLHEVRVSLHPEVTVTVTMNVARSQEEAERQARGEDVTARTDDEDDEDDLDLDALLEDDEEDGASADGDTDDAEAEAPAQTDDEAEKA
ncbi:MAG: 50S ribosomal protein L9 [Alphaproteobacteria bacterium]